MKGFLTLLLVLTYPSVLPPKSQPTVPEMAFVGEARARIQQMIMEEDIVGLAVSVSVDDQLVWSEGFGYRDLNRQHPIDPSETYFRIASLSKPITATLLGKL